VGRSDSDSARLRTLIPPRSVLLGPMAGVAEAPFRAICKRMGATLTYSEMISATGLERDPNSRTARELLTFDAEETPCAVQFYGTDPKTMAEQARNVLDRCGADVALIDINMGCPVAKVVNKGGGSGLMRTPELAEAIVAAVVSACDVPVTVKMRSGWDAESVNAVEFARRMEAAGAAAVAVHGRTRGQFYRGRADWAVIAEVKRALSIPVFGSGDVWSARDVLEMFEQTNVDAVFAARGAQGNPWIFREARHLLDTGEELAPPTPFERIDTAREHAEALIELIGEHGVKRMRKHVCWYAHGLPGATHLRVKVNATVTSKELEQLLLEYRKFLETGEHAESFREAS
jgi:tRNA-dihydrouridine synthase B